MICKQLGIFTQWPKQLLFPALISSFCFFLISQQVKRVTAQWQKITFKKWQIMTKKIHHFLKTVAFLLLSIDSVSMWRSSDIGLHLLIRFILHFPEYKSIRSLNNILIHFVTWVNCPFNNPLTERPRSLRTRCCGPCTLWPFSSRSALITALPAGVWADVTRRCQFVSDDQQAAGCLCPTQTALLCNLLLAIPSYPSFTEAPLLYFFFFLPSRHWELDVSLTFQHCGGNRRSKLWVWHTFKRPRSHCAHIHFCPPWLYLWSPPWLAETWRGAAAAERALGVFKSLYLNTWRESEKFPWDTHSAQHPFNDLLVHTLTHTHTHIFFVK